MNSIIENIRIVFPFFAFSWLLTIISTMIWPYKYRNAVLLMNALFFTLLFTGALFGRYIGTALIVIFFICFAALLFIPLMLIANGIAMLKREGFAVSHLLSLGLGLFVAAGEVGFFISVMSEVNGAHGRPANILSFFVGSSVLYFSILMLAFVLYMLLLQAMPHRRSFDYIIIHGCGLRSDGTVTRLLSDRLDKAIKVYNRSRGKKPMLIPSGGQGPDELRSEASAMSEYLESRGIPRESILREDRSTTTEENLRFSKELISRRGDGRRIALISSNYHVYRCLCIASRLGMKCSGIGARTAAYYWPSAVIREFAAFALRGRTRLLIAAGYFIFTLVPVLSLMSAA